MNRIRRALPGTPKKVTEVVKELYNELTPRSQKRITKPSNTSKNAISDETQQLVREFYEEPSNSRVMPGEKDLLSVRNQGTNVKEKMRKRLLLGDRGST